MADHNIKKTAFSALPIGIASAAIGYVIIRGEDGIERLLQLGDRLFSGDEITTGSDGHAVIDLIDGSKIELDDQSTVVLDDDVIDAKTLEQVQQALLADIQPSAGAAGGHGSIDIAQVDINEPAGSDVQDSDTLDLTGVDDSFSGSAPTSTPTPLPPETAPEITPPDNPVGSLPTLSIADTVVQEPAPAGGPGGPGGPGGGHDSGDDSDHDSGHDSGDDSGHDSGHDTDHDSGHDSGHEGGHDTTPTYAVFTLTLSQAALTDVTVDFTTADGTAISGGTGVNAADYGHNSGTITIPAGETTATIEIEILGDRGVESDSEFFYVNLSNAQGATIEDGQAIATIIDSGHGTGDTGEGEIITGTSGDDILTGSGGSDTIYGEAGDDTISGRGAADTIYGGAGDDTIEGIGGPDTIYGGAGNDQIAGQGSPDILDGGPGNDVISGGGARDAIYGGEGNDTLYGDGAPDVLDGGPGSDILVGGGGGDVFRFENLGEADTITDFKPQQGDAIDISAILDGYSASDPISNYVQLQETPEADTYELLVNPTGSGLDEFQLLVTLENMEHTTTVDDLLDNGNLIVTTIT